MRIPDSVLQSIAEKLDIGQVIGEYVTLKPQGGRLWGLCPFHGEKTPSFSVTPDRGMYYCFGCHKGGSLFNFFMEAEKLTFVEAVDLLAKRAGVELPASDGDRERDSKRAALRELYERVAGSFHYCLTETAEAAPARAYLAGRALTDDTVRTFKIGYAPSDRSWLHRFLLKKSYSEAFLAASGLFTAKNPRSALFGARVMFPISDRRGGVVAFGGRILAGEGPKYINSPETEIFRKGDTLFGLDRALPGIRAQGFFILVEGYTDVLALSQAGVDNAVAPLGTAFTEQQARLLRRYVERGVLLFDGDDAGLAAARRAILLCERVGIAPEVVELPEGLDPAEILQRQGTEALHNFTKYPINSFVFLVERALRSHDVGKPEGKEAVLRELTPYIENIDSEVRREGCLGAVADALHVDRDAVARDFARLRTDRGQEATGAVKGTVISPDLYLMLAVAANRRSFALVRSRLSTDDLEDARARRLYIAFEEAFRRGDDSLGGLLDSVDDAELRELVLEKLSGDEFSINQDELIKQSVASLKRLSVERRSAEVTSLLRAAQTEGRPFEELKSLIADKAFLDRELEKLRVNTNDRAAD